MTPDEHRAAIDAMLARGDLDAHDHALASARVAAAVRRGQPVPPLPERSRIDDRHTRRRARRGARTERHETGMTRADQQRRDAVSIARDARDAEVIRLQAVADRALAEGRISASDHADTRWRLERLAREPVRPAVDTPPALSGLAALAAVLDALAD